MNMKKLLVVLLAFILLPWVFPSPKAHALKDLVVSVNPALPGALAEHKFHFTIEKRLKIHEWMKFKFPEGTRLPLEEDLPPPKLPCVPPPEIDHDNNIIKIFTHVELDPEIFGYSDIIVTFPKDLGIYHPETPGSYVFQFSTQAEPEWVKSKPVSIAMKTEQPVFHQFEFKMDLEYVGIEESTEPWEAKVQLQNLPSLTGDFKNEGFFVSQEELRILFHWSYFAHSISQESKPINYYWSDRSNYQIHFSRDPQRGMQKERISMPRVNGIEQAWTHEPMMYKDKLFVNVMDIARFLKYDIEMHPNENYFTIYDHFGRTYQFFTDPARVSIKQSGDRYLYNYRMLTPVKNHNNRLRMDLGFILYHFLSIDEVIAYQFEPYQWEITYLGKDQLSNQWQFLFYFDSTPGKENLKNVIPLFINNKWIAWNPIMVSTEKNIKFRYDETQVLAPLRGFFEAAGAEVAWDNDQQKTLVILDSE